MLFSSIKINFPLYLLKTSITLFLLLQLFNFVNCQLFTSKQQNNEAIAAIYSPKQQKVYYNNEQIMNNNNSEEILSRHCSVGKPCKSGLIIPVEIFCHFLFKNYLFLIFSSGNRR